MEGVALQRLFSTFPAGLPGLGLLILRGVLGGTLLVEGLAQAGALGILASACGASLIGGMLTPLAAVLGGLSAVAFGPGEGSGLVLAHVVSVSAALALLGPGAFSLDARRYGRRELVVPRRRSE